MPAKPRTPRSGSKGAKRAVDRASMAEISGERFGEAMLMDLFRKFDVDSSGSIDESELYSAMKLLGVHCSMNSAKKVLAEIDSNLNGSVEWDEFRDFFGKVGSPEDVKLLLSKQNQCFFEYKQAVKSDPGFAKAFTFPPSYEVAKKFDGHQEAVERVAWLSDDLFASASIDGEVLIWSAGNTDARPKPERRLKVGNGCALYSMCVSPDAKQMLIGLDHKEENLTLWDVAEGRMEGFFPGHQTSVYSCTFSHDQTVIASGSKCGHICFHDGPSRTLQKKMKVHGGVVHSVAFRGQSSTICTGSKDGTVKIFDTRHLSDEAKADLVIEDAAASETVTQAMWRSEEEIMTCGDDYCIKRWDIRHLKRGAVSSYFGHTSEVRSIELSTDRSFLVSGTYDGGVRVWNVDERGMVRERLAQAEAQLRDLVKLRDAQEEKFGNGECDASDLKATHEQVGLDQALVEKLSEVNKRLTVQGFTQAFLSLDSSTLPVASIAWRDGDSAGTARLIVGSQDQAVRLYHLDLGKVKSTPF